MKSWLDKGASARRISWSLWLLSALLLAIGVPLGELAGIGARGLVESLTYATVGAIVASRRPENPIGWLFCALGVVVSFEFFGTEYVNHALSTAPGSLPNPDVMTRVTRASTELSITLAIFVFLLFPFGRLLSIRWRVVAWLAAAFGFAASLAALLLAVRSSVSIAVLVPESVHLTGILRASEGLLGVLVVASAGSVFLRQHRASGEERQQLKWFTYAVGVVVATAIVSLVVTRGDASFALWVTPIVPIAAGLAILKYHLFDIDVLINRTMVYGVLTAVLGLTYFLCVLALQHLLSSLTQDSQLAVAGSTLAVAALFRPARTRTQSLINRRLYRTRYDAPRILEAFSSKTRDEVELDALTGDLLSVVQVTMQPAHVSLWLRTLSHTNGQERHESLETTNSRWSVGTRPGTVAPRASSPP